MRPLVVAVGASYVFTGSCVLLQDDDTDIAHQVASLKWHNKELEVSPGGSVPLLVVVDSLARMKYCNT